jgi:DNA/RNA endonuclease YhcR with UshA esterase domain
MYKVQEIEMKISIKKMSLVASALTCLYMLTAQAESAIDSSKAAFYVGKELMVCGTVAEVRPFSKGTYINMGARYPNQHISFLVWETDHPKFNARFGSLSVFQGAQACAHGLVENYRSTLQIKVSNPQFLRLMK